MGDIQYDPACRDCRAVAGRENANTTWQCAAHVIAERDMLRGEVMSLRRWRTEQDCRYTLGTVADIDGSHCPSDKPCERCQSERERDRLREALHALCWHAIAWRSNGWVPATGALDDACELVGREALEMKL